MKIGIDAKRIFANNTGLGSYGRNLINGLAQLVMPHQIILYSPNKSKLFNTSLLPKNFTTFFSNARIKAYWRSFSIINNLKKDGIQIYHGISSELPFSLKKHKEIIKIVDIHDLLFLRFPSFYNISDRKLFELKTKFACEIADKIVATSQATKQDIIDYYKIDDAKIEVIYQSCADIFYQKVSTKTIESTLKKYQLPDEYILCVGTVQERKNQKQIIEALHLCQHKLPLVLIGEGKKYKDELLALAIKYNITVHIPTVFVKDEHLPAIYQQAKLFVFPGLYEGFGIPVLEAMASKTLVITSLNTSMAEIVNETECLINPLSAEDLADKIDLFLSTNQEILIEKNYNRSLEFTSQHFAKNVLALYEKFDS